MLEPKRIHVTTSDITLGERSSGTSCPIALALHRAYPDTSFIIGAVYMVVVIASSTLSPEYPLPFRLIKWINAYDRKYHVQPITFTFPFEE